MASVVLSMCFMSMLAFTIQAVPSRAQQSKKTSNAELVIREEYQPEFLGSRDMAESRNAEIRATVLDQSPRNLRPRNMRMLVDTAPREYLESREADHREAITNRHQKISRTADLRGRRRNFEIDAFSSSLAAPNPSQVPALLAFRKALDAGSLLTSWNTSNSCEQWKGLTCDSNYFVTQIILGSYQLTGSIPDSIGNLTSLQVLELTSNQLNGSIPNSIGNLTSLQVLILSNNSIQGMIPGIIGNLLSLTDLKLDSNFFQGSIPDSIGNLKSLQVLELTSNILNGFIPNSIGNLTSLQVLILSNNFIHGMIPSTIGNLLSLTDLKLDSNQFQDFIPDSIGNLKSLANLNLTKNALTSSIPDSIGNLTSLVVLNLDFNQLTGSIPDSLGNLKSLADLSVSGNLLAGTVPESYANMKTLVYLDMSQNNFFGPFPDFTGNLPTLSSLRMYRNRFYGPLPANFWAPPNLTYVDISDNYMNGRIPLVPTQPNAPSFMYQGNCLVSGGSLTLTLPQRNTTVCGSFYLVLPTSPPASSPPASSPPATSPPATSFPVVAVIVPVIFVILLVFATVGIICFRRQKNDSLKVDLRSDFEREIESLFVRSVTLAEVEVATNGFDSDSVVGKGAFGVVYRGLSVEGEVWAVKRAKEGKVDNMEEFRNEVRAISRISHSNLVRLVGFCAEGREQILIYEFCANGTLTQHIRPKGVSSKVLSFEQRLNIAIGASEGLRYMHTFANPAIIHRDIKSDNILLDKNMQSKVADFGLLKSVPSGEELADQGKGVARTPGYIDPEYFMTGRVTDKSDVFSFGVVLLELITGKPPTFVNPDSEDKDDVVALSRWASSYVKLAQQDMPVDPLLEGHYPHDSMCVMAKVAVECVERLSIDRPNMTQVANRLGALKTMQDQLARGQSNHIPISSEASKSGYVEMGGTSQADSRGLMFDSIQIGMGR